MGTRNRLKQTATLQERLAAFARQQRDKAATLPEGAERVALLQKADQADTTAQMDYAPR
jgi:hypothetical protein